LTLGDTQQIKLDVNPFLIDLIEFKEKKVLVRTDQATSTAGKNVVMSDELRNRMIKPRQPEIGVWKENTWRKRRPEWRPTSSFLIEKYTREHWESVFSWLGGYKQRGSPEHGGRYGGPLFRPQHRQTRQLDYPS
jgi:hypothetical protein